MKIFSYLLLCLIFFILIFTSFSNNNQTVVSAYEYDYLRIHIIANSNNVKDQELKIKLKNKIVDFLTPYLADCEDKESAKKLVNDNISIINEIVGNTMRLEGANYGAKTELKTEYFPSRYYEEYVLESGNYDALIITLGDGLGDNWWCCIYPPLCFVNKNINEEQNIVYQSKLIKIIKKFFN